MDNNEIRFIEGLTECHRLQELSLANNKITHIENLDNLPLHRLCLKVQPTAPNDKRRSCVHLRHDLHIAVMLIVYLSKNRIADAIVMQLRLNTTNFISSRIYLFIDRILSGKVFRPKSCFPSPRNFLLLLDQI